MGFRTARDKCPVIAKLSRPHELETRYCSVAAIALANKKIGQMAVTTIIPKATSSNK